MQMSGNTQFVYVNGEMMSLLEDGRLALYQRFPVGSLLYDPSDLPPREVPLSTAASEHGITACRLVPNGHYEAYLPDFLTGDLHPLTGESVCVYVTGLPPNTTAEMLGRFFETFDMVAEADVFRTVSGACTGRGWVVLQDPSKLYMVPPVMEFFPRVFIRTALSDKVPMRKTHEPISSRGVHILGTNAASYAAPNHNRVGSHKKLNGKPSTGILKPPTSLPLSVANASCHYFVALISKDELDMSIEKGIFWTSAENQRAFYSTLDRGPVILIFFLREYTALVGYARLLPLTKGDRNESSGCLIEWLKHHVLLREEHMMGIHSIPISKMGDGVPLKPEIGESLCHLADQFPSLSTIPEELNQRPRNGQYAARGGSVAGHPKGVARGGGGVYAVGGRGALRPGAAPVSPQQSVRGRMPARGGHGVNSNNRVSSKRHSYEHTNTYSGTNGGGGGNVFL